MNTWPSSIPKRATEHHQHQASHSAPLTEMADIEMGRLPEPSSRREKDAALLSSLPETDYKPVDWRRLLLRRRYIPLYILGLLLLVATVFITIKHDAVVSALRPVSERIRALPAGWLIPIAILIVISFPPLFGHELVALLCGVVYGLWPGFGVVAAGTFLGEACTWFAFKRLLRRRTLRLERSNLDYGALARLTRDGGFPVVLVVRFSVVPSHFSTAVFSTCDVKFWHFCAAALLTLPKQILLVYLGVLLAGQQTDALAKGLVFGLGGAATLVAGVYVWRRMGAAKKVLLEEQEGRRREREGLAGSDTASVKSDGEAGESDTASLVPLRLGDGWDGSPSRI